jgi:hypothetical protein
LPVEASLSISASADPVAVAGSGEQRLVDVDLLAARDEVAGALGDDRARLVVVGLVQEAAARIDTTASGTWCRTLTEIRMLYVA